MTFPAVSTIAQVLYPSEQAFDFARIAADLERVLSRLFGPEVRMEWNCDDLISFDLLGSRLLLSCAEFEGAFDGATAPDLDPKPAQACLTLACGPVVPVNSLADHQALCRQLVDRIAARFPPKAVLWSEARGALDGDLIDMTLAALPQQALRLPPVDSILDRVAQSDRIATGTSLSGLVAAQIWSRRFGDKPQRRSVAWLRRVLSPVHTSAATSIPMRLTAHCFNATLILIYAPLGVAMMVYAFLKGEDVHFSARLMALAGTLFAVAHTPLGQVVKAMAGV